MPDEFGCGYLLETDTKATVRKVAFDDERVLIAEVRGAHRFR